MQFRNNTCSSLLHAHVSAPGIENHVGACLEAFFKAYIEMGGMPAAFYLRPLGQFLICSPSGEVDQLERGSGRERERETRERTLLSGL